MSELSFSFATKPKDKAKLMVFLVGEDRALGDLSAEAVPDKLFARASKAADFTGKSLSVLNIVAPEGVAADRIIFVGIGDPSKMEDTDWVKLGGKIGGLVTGAKHDEICLILERPDGRKVSVEHAVGVLSGMKLRAYKFDRYKTKKCDDEDSEKPTSFNVRVVHEKSNDIEKDWVGETGVLDGVLLARTLVNEPANILGPIEFADQADALTKLGVETTILDEKDMAKLGMNAFLGVGQGSRRPPRLVVMKWMGGKKNEAPAAFIGKGVVFDTGGISLKPGSGMEDMKGDMGGAAAVTGFMHAVAARKAKANVIGVIGLVENMPDGNAQRPGDIVTSMSGQTIEVINTDAEGRLVLCDLLHYVNHEFEPKFMVDLATLTGAIIVALGNHHAGLFCNDDDLALKIAGAGRKTGELVWRMPLAPDYDKLIESKFADMKNVGSRSAGSITAAQFLKRFVGETPWAHLDIAGTALGSPQTEINKSWGSGFGVRLLDQLVRDHCE